MQGGKNMSEFNENRSYDTQYGMPNKEKKSHPVLLVLLCTVLSLLSGALGGWFAMTRFGSGSTVVVQSEEAGTSPATTVNSESGNKTISEEKASLIIKEVLSAIAYLHQNQICHRDLKPENIMFSRENDLSSIKIIDFGLSLQNFDTLCNSDYCGTLIYMAPEEINRKSYYLSVDIWSIGILMYMLLKIL